VEFRYLILSKKPKINRMNLADDDDHDLHELKNEFKKPNITCGDDGCSSIEKGNADLLLTWQRRLYDTRECGHPSARISQKSPDPMGHVNVLRQPSNPLPSSMLSPGGGTSHVYEEKQNSYEDSRDLDQYSNNDAESDDDEHESTGEKRIFLDPDVYNPMVNTESWINVHRVILSGATDSELKRTIQTMVGTKKSNKHDQNITYVSTVTSEMKNKNEKFPTSHQIQPER